MNPQTSNNGSQSVQTFSPEWVYDEIMQYIEPDLMMGHIAVLDEAYKGESAADRVLRYGNYEMAFQIFDQAVLMLDESMRADVAELKEEMIAIAKELAAKDESAELQNIEQSLSDDQ